MNIIRGRVRAIKVDGDATILSLDVKDLLRDYDVHVAISPAEAAAVLHKGDVIEIAVPDQPDGPSGWIRSLERGPYNSASVGKKMWKAKLRQWGNRCAKCGKLCKPSEMTQGHLLPDSKEGRRHSGNLVPLCKACNAADADALAVYELITADDRLAPDHETRTLLAREASASGRPIHVQVEFRDFAIDRRVELVVDIEALRFPDATVRGIALGECIGTVHSVNMGEEEYWIDLDDAVTVCHSDGTTAPTHTVIAGRNQFEYLDPKEHPPTRRPDASPRIIITPWLPAP